MVVLDTSFLIDLIQRDTIAREKLIEFEENAETICTTVINALELYKGVYRSSRIEQNKHEVDDILSGIVLLSFDSEVHTTFGMISSHLLLKGLKIGDFDELIASICLAHNQCIITRDPHFDRVPGLSVIRY